jgi:hypothetical protein
MRIGSPAVSPGTSAWSAQLAQTLVQIAANRSSSSDRPVEPIGPIQSQMGPPRVDARILDIHV